MAPKQSRAKQAARRGHSPTVPSLEEAQDIIMAHRVEPDDMGPREHHDILLHAALLDDSVHSITVLPNPPRLLL